MPSILPKYQRLPINDAQIDYYPQYLTQQTAQDVFNTLMQQVDWQQYHVTVFGKTHATPRLSAWYGDKGYTYSGLYHEPRAWLPALLRLRQMLVDELQSDFNSVLLNLYRDGSDSMGCHSDDEKELGPEPVIASLSLGVTRDFILQHKTNKTKHKIALSDGDLIVMRGQTQKYWKHAIHKSKKIQQARINLTFRKII